MKNTIKSLSLLLCLLFLAHFVSAEEKKAFKSRFSLKIAAGFGSNLPIGDVNDCLDSVNQAFEDWRRARPDLISGEINKLDDKMSQWEVELRFDLTRWIGIGIATSAAFDKKNESSVSLSRIGYQSLYTTTLTYKPHIKSFPIRLNLYYSPLYISKASVFVSAGIGFYPTKISQYRYYSMKSPFGEGWNSFDWEVSREFALGFHAGGGAEVQLLQRIALVLEFQYRHIKMSGLKGKMVITTNSGTQDEINGILYYYKEFDENIVAQYAKFEVHSEPPLIGVGFPTEVREAILDLSGYSIRIGIRIKLF